MRPSSTPRSRPRTWRRRGALLALLGGLAAPGAAADQNDPRLDGLFARLAASDDARHALGIERRIWDIWLHHENPALTTRIRRASDAIAAGLHAEAIAMLDDLVARAPDFAEAWNKRATARYLAGDHAGSVDDIVRTLALEPRHFGALSGLALIYRGTGQPAAAAEALRRALAIHPRMRFGEERLRELERETGRPA